MDEIEPQREAKRGGNTRPLWTPILTEVEREKALITGMLRGARAFLKKGECAEWYQANLRSADWDIEWRIAQGKLPDTLARRRKRVAMPAVSREREAVWKRIQSTASTAPLVRLKEVQEDLTVPTIRGKEAYRTWISRLKERHQMLARISRVGERAKLMEFKLEREEWQANFEEGYTKDLVAKVLNKSKGGHIIDNVILDTGDGLRLSCAAWEVREETERFFYEWMRSRAREWGTDEERREGQFPKLEKVVADSEFQPKEVLSDVSKAIVEVLNRRRTDPTRRRDKLYAGLDQLISFTEMEEFFGKVKKGTAPGVSGVPVEL